MPRTAGTAALVAIMVLSASVPLAGCLSVPEDPTVEITSPLDDQALGSGDVTVRVNVNHFRTVDRQGEANADGEGHLHFYMDVDPIPGAPGQPAIPAGPNATWADLAVTSHTFYGVPPGAHTFAVQLVNNDHTPLDPPVDDSVAVTVRA
jgi:hypothetical protein